MTATRSTSAERFTLDTNILVYAADSLSGERHRRAVALVLGAATANCVLTLQSLGEFFYAVTRKAIVPKAVAAAQVRDWMIAYPTIAADRAALDDALVISSGGRLGFWDALLVATAKQTGCSLVLSEDMQDGATVSGVTILNPFVGDKLPPAVERLLDRG